MGDNIRTFFWYMWGFIIDGILWLLGSQEKFDKKYNSQAIQREQSKTQKAMLNELRKANAK